MKKLFRYKRIFLLGLMPLSYLLIFAAKNSSFFAEQIYAKHIYRWISQSVSTITGIFPFSIGEIMVIASPILLLAIAVRFIVRLFFEKKNKKERIVKAFLNLLCVGSVILFLFTIMAGINYYRYSFSKYSHLEIRDSSLEELYALTQSLADTANELRAQVPKEDDNGVFKLSMNHYELAKAAVKAYRVLSIDYPVLAGSYGPPKPVYFSKLMSQTEITGIFWPFTMEANVNVDIPDYSIPETMLHELAHLRGFMREDEANFLSYLAGTESDNIELKYSTTMLALITASNALYDQSPVMYTEIANQYSEGVIKDLQANNEYWEQFEHTVVSTVSNKINDTYLKANNQSDGVKSYGRMLDLLLAKYRKDHDND
jgi:hypothetical protein